MIRVTITDTGGQEKVSREETESALMGCNPDIPESLPGAVSEGDGGAFAHIGAIGPHGRESYQKFSAVFGSGPYPGSNCGISILGAGSIANLRKLIEDS